MNKIYCTNCGKQILIDNDHLYCYCCGNKLEILQSHDLEKHTPIAKKYSISRGELIFVHIFFTLFFFGIGILFGFFTGDFLTGFLVFSFINGFAILINLFFTKEYYYCLNNPDICIYYNKEEKYFDVYTDDGFIKVPMNRIYKVTANTSRGGYGNIIFKLNNDRKINSVLVNNSEKVKKDIRKIINNI